jgi:hypothetical protein
MSLHFLATNCRTKLSAQSQFVCQFFFGFFFCARGILPGGVQGQDAAQTSTLEEGSEEETAGGM